MNSLKKQINEAIYNQTEEFKNSHAQGGMWGFIEVKIKKKVSEKIAKTICYLLENKHWRNPSFEYCQDPTGVECIKFTFENPLTYDI